MVDYSYIRDPGLDPCDRYYRMKRIKSELNCRCPLVQILVYLRPRYIEKLAWYLLERLLTRHSRMSTNLALFFKAVGFIISCKLEHADLKKLMLRQLLSKGLQM